MKRASPKLLTDPTVELIEAYTFKVRPIEQDGYTSTDGEAWARTCAERGGFNPHTRRFTPLKFTSRGMQVHEALDAITAAVEAGIVDMNDWSQQLFENDDEFQGFLEELQDYDECYRITDRWWLALAEIAGRSDEEGFITCRDIADGLRESVTEGEKRKTVLLQEAEYKARPESKPARLNKKQTEMLDEFTRDVLRQAWKLKATKDVTCDFRFENPFFELRGKTLYAREARIEDFPPKSPAKKLNSDSRAATVRSAKI